MERRRRDKINNWIVTLSKIIPDCSIDSRTGAVSAEKLRRSRFVFFESNDSPDGSSGVDRVKEASCPRPATTSGS